MKNSCNIVRDLLPLYAEGLASAESCAFVEAHLAECPDCRAELEGIRSGAAQIPDGGLPPLKKLRRELRIRRAKAVAFTAALVVLVLTCLSAHLTAPSYLPYEEGLIAISEGAEGSLIVTFAAGVADCECLRGTDPDTGRSIYFISAWDSAWNRFGPARSAPVMALLDADASIYYSQNNGEEDVLIYGENVHDGGGVTTLPRLALGYYLLLAAACALVLLAARLLLRRNKRLRRGADCLLSLPVAYILGHLCVKGSETATYSLQKDFFLILLAAVCICCALLLGLHLWRIRGLRREP